MGDTHGKKPDDDEQDHDKGWSEPRSQTRSSASKPSSGLNTSPQSLV
jgi:hypothetical protein